MMGDQLRSRVSPEFPLRYKQRHKQRKQQQQKQQQERQLPQ